LALVSDTFKPLIFFKAETLEDLAKGFIPDAIFVYYFRKSTDDN
jgi:hypothetical protein